MEVCREIKRLIDSYNVSEEWCEEALKMLKEIYSVLKCEEVFEDHSEKIKKILHIPGRRRRR